MARVLIAGCGYTGIALGMQLASEGHTVWGLRRRPELLPAAIQPLTYLMPLRYYLVMLRAIFLKGVGLETLWPEALALAGWGMAVLALAVARSTKRIA